MVRLPLVAAASLLAATTLSAQVVGYHSTYSYYNSSLSRIVSAAGMTGVQINTMAGFDFNTIDILLLDNVGGNPSNMADIGAWVFNGGMLASFDWQHSRPAPGLEGVVYGNAWTECVYNMNRAGSNAITDGPFGTITNSTLDGGNCSSHGGWYSSSVPAGAEVFLTSDARPELATAMGYSYGAGRVFYSDTPMVCYTMNYCTNPPGDAMVNIYGPNALAYLDGSSADVVPEPASMALMGTGLIAIGAFARRRRK